MKINKIIQIKVARYLLILLIPLVVISVFVYKKVIYSYKENIINSNAKQLSYIQTQIENEIQSVIKIAIGCNDEEVFSNDLIKQNPYMGKGIIDYFKKNKAMTQSTHTIAYYPYDSEYIYTDKSSMLVETFCQDIYKYTNLSTETFKKEILNAQYVVFHPSENLSMGSVEGDFITFSLPISNQKGNFIALFPESFILNNFDTNNNNIVIINDTSDIILSTLGKDASIIKKLSTKKDVITIEGIDYLITTKPFKMIGWDFYFLSKTNFVLGPIKQTSMLYAVILIILVVIIGAFIAYIALKEYNSLGRLLSSIDKYISNEDKGDPDEYNRIKSTIQYLEKTISNLKLQYSKNRPLFVGQKILQLVTGEYTEYKSLINELEDLNVVFKQKRYVVVSIKSKSQDNISLMEVLFGQSFAVCDSYRANSTDRHLIIYLVAYNSKVIFQQCLEDYINKCANSKFEIAIGISEEYYNVEEIYNGLDQSNIALNYKVLLGYNIPIYYQQNYENYNLKKIDTILLNNILKSLEGSLTKHQLNESKNLITNYFKVVEESNASPIEIAIPCSNIIYFFINFVNSRNIDNQDIFNYFVDVIFNFDNIKDLERDICTICSNIVEHSMLDNDEDTLISEILDTVEKSFRDVNFSISTLSQQYDMSVSNLSHYYKRKTGETFSNGLASRRIKHAIELLCSTDLAIKDVGIDSGYYSIGTFLRNFKRLTGTIPSTYRKQIAKDKDTSV